MALTPETVPVELDLEVPDYQYRSVALEYALQWNGEGEWPPSSIVSTAAVFEEYLRNGATK